MRETTVTDVGEFAATLTAGQCQKVIFTEQDDGPFWLNAKERTSLKYDRRKDTIASRNRTKTELLIELNRKGCNTTLPRFTKKEIITLCAEYILSTVTNVQDIIPGWVNLPKGMLQILYERGFIDPVLVEKPSKMRYSKLGKKNDFDNQTGKLKVDCVKYCCTFY